MASHGGGNYGTRAFNNAPLSPIKNQREYGHRPSFERGGAFRKTRPGIRCRERRLPQCHQCGQDDHPGPPGDPIEGGQETMTKQKGAAQ